LTLLQHYVARQAERRPDRATNRAGSARGVKIGATRPEALHPALRATTWFTAAALAGLRLYLAACLFFPPGGQSAGLQAIAEMLATSALWSALAVGLLAQMVNGMSVP